MYIVMNFILIEDNHFFNEKITKIINEYMKRTYLDYKIYPFFDYTAEVYKIIDDNTIQNKIYILDIVCPSNKGTNVATHIRKNDIKSFLIFITDYYDDYQQTMLSEYFMFLAFINKKQNYKEDLFNALHLGTKAINDNNIVRIEKGTLRLTLAKKDILYVHIKDRRTYIVTRYETFDLSMSLQEIFFLLKNGFMYCHKSIIINVLQIRNIVSKTREVYFDEEHYVVASKVLIKEVIDEFEKLCTKKGS